jgi:hypothetical protein
VEARLAEYQAKHGHVAFGGHLDSSFDRRFAVPDNLGVLPPPQVAAPSS